MQAVQSFIHSHQRTVHAVSPSQTVWEALHTMAKHNIGAVLVVNDGEMVGIFSERDYARRVELKGLETKSTRISDVMTSKFVSISPSTTMDDCMQIMTEHRVRHLPVIAENNEILGLVSIGDVVSEMISAQRDVISQLKQYIAG